MMWSIVIGSLSQWAPTLGTNVTEEINHQHMIQELQSTARYTAGKPILRLLDAVRLVANTKSSRNDRERETKDIRARYQPWGVHHTDISVYDQNYDRSDLKIPCNGIISDDVEKKESCNGPFLSGYIPYPRPTSHSMRDIVLKML